MRRWLASDLPIPVGVERELREVLINRVMEIGKLIGYSVNPPDRSVFHYPTYAAFRYDDAGSVTLIHPGMTAWEDVPSVLEGAKIAVRQERERDKATAERFIRELAWWLTHASGRPVPAPGHADRLYMSEHGWAVDFGGNSFLVGRAIERCTSALDQYRLKAEEGQVVPRSQVEATLKRMGLREIEWVNFGGGSAKNLCIG